MGVNQIASKLSWDVEQDFIKKNSDQLVCLDRTPDEILKVVMASAELDREAREEILFWMKGIDQPDPYARDVAQKDFKRVLYEIVARFFIQAIQDGVIKPSMEFTPEADAQLRELNFVLDPSLRPAPVPVIKPLSPAEALEQEVISDYAKLSGDRMRAKINGNSAYRATYERLAYTDKLESRCTTNYDISRVGG